MNLKDEISLHATANMEAVDVAIQKAERLHALLKEANSLARELASNGISLKVEIDG